MKSKAAGLTLGYRLAVTSRCCAALFGGYLLATMGSICLSLLLPLPTAEAVLVGMMSSFLFFLGAIIWCFATHSAWRAWLGVLLPSVVLGAINGLMYWADLP